MILITGGSGYLGSKVADFFLKSGSKVRIATSQDNLVLPKDLSKCKISKIDFMDQSSLDKACEDINYIFHFAATDYLQSTNNPEKAKKVNEQGTKNLINASIKNKIKKFVYLSTIHVYGNNLKKNVSEKTIPKPTNPYASTHYNAEKIIQEDFINTNIKYLILRLSNVISPPLTKKSNCWKLVAHDLCKQSIISRKIKLNTTGSQVRDFISIQILYEIINEFLLNNYNSELYNLANGSNHSINEIAALIQKLCNKNFGYSPNIITGNSEENSNKYELDISKIKKKFRSFQQHSIEESLNELLNYCNKIF